ncbi:hypothetical protein [Clostridium botulinum]|uniref:hypothetical protein n=1 Tax=Clostridium botulinum TaxID=1491 RepID=UPI000774B772|nr:hypothetical protein [Clostridium botulinum]MBY6931689.1 hypothetical protein [Clostridium botulinum]NFG20517.1 hypothetical protein [Clostridium botulinum]NFO80699.1 hypothetical protein [Clostridium botulinum]
MIKEDIILNNIIEAICKDDENKNFKSIKDKSYRLEVIRWLFIGLERERQDLILRLMKNQIIDQLSLELN